MSDNIAADTAQKIRFELERLGWQEVKSQQYQYPGIDTAIEVGYVYGECTVHFLPIDHRGAEEVRPSWTRRRETDRGVGVGFWDRVLERVTAMTQYADMEEALDR